MAFGPDGFLYIAFGDGGSGGDPLGNGQNLQTLLGKIARIGVDLHAGTGLQYAIPADNPFVGTADRGRNLRLRLSQSLALFIRAAAPAAFSSRTLDRTNSKKSTWYKRAAIMAGTRWRERIASVRPAVCNMTGLTLPIAEYDHSEGATVIGGYVYHGTAVAALAGVYILGDFGNGKIWKLTESSGTWTRTLLLNSGHNMSAFGQDAAGELYVVDYSPEACLRSCAVVRSGVGLRPPTAATIRPSACLGFSSGGGTPPRQPPRWRRYEFNLTAFFNRPHPEGL